jgi:Predicted membrane protein
MDWNLRSCGRHGHVTYAPTEEELRERLHAQTPLGAAWRCLRCGDYVLGPPRGTGPAEDAPEVLRGKALRDAVILRLLAVERGVRALLVLAAGYGVWRFRAHRNAVQRAFEEDLPLLRPIAEKLHFNLDDSSIVHTLHSVIEARTSTLAAVAVGLLVYGALQLVEAVGLWLLKRWGEYFAVVATSLGIPIELYELAEKVTVIRVGALVLNLAAVIYLVWTKRLFGVRGGKHAYEAERHEVSLLEVEVAGASVKLTGRPGPAGRPEPAGQPGG